MNASQAAALLTDLYRRNTLAYVLERALLVASGILPVDAPV